MEGLCETVRGEWSGDVDLHDGQLQEMFQQYQSRLQFINKIGLDERRDHSLILTSPLCFILCAEQAENSPCDGNQLRTQ